MKCFPDLEPLRMPKRIRARCVTPMRPDMPVKGRSFDNWKQAYAPQLRWWFISWYGYKPEQNTTEWEIYLGLQFDAELELAELELKE